MKPIYYHHDEAMDSFVFASEIQPLLALPGVRRETWMPGLDAYLATKAVFGDRTLFDSIRAVPRATTMVFSRRGELRVQTRQVPEDSTEHRRADPAEAAAAVRDLLRAEVGRLAVADVPDVRRGQRRARLLVW